MSQLRWGLLGTAHITTRLIPAMRAARRSRVAAVASRDPARAARHARDWNIPAAHPSYEALLRDRAIDAVYVALPNALHVEWTLRALDAGKHVLCEKPLAPSGEDVDRVRAVARARDRLVAEAFMYRHEPLFARMVAMVRDGSVGSVETIDAGFTFLRRREHDIRLDAGLGGGSLWDVGCYAVSAALALVPGPPIEAFGWARAAPGGVDESFTGLLRWADGVAARVHSSFRAPLRTWLDVTGTDGVLRVRNPFKPGPRETIDIDRGGQIETTLVEGSAELFVRQIDDFVAAALDGRPPAMSLDDSRDVAAALAALHRSVERGRPVQL